MSTTNRNRGTVTPIDVAFVQLRGLLPRFLNTRKASKMNKVEIIRQTLNYIVILNQMLGKNQ